MKDKRTMWNIETRGSALIYPLENKSTLAVTRVTTLEKIPEWRSMTITRLEGKLVGERGNRGNEKI